MNSDYRPLVDSLNRIADADGPDEVTQIIMETVALAGIEGRGEMAAAVILISQYSVAQTFLHNFRQVVDNIPKKGTAESSKSWEATTNLASAFLSATLEDLWSLRGEARPEDVSWKTAINIAEDLLEEIARNFEGLVGQLQEKEDVH